MKLSDLSIRRPVLASMLSLALVLFGALGYFQLSVREFPDVDPPIVSVSTVLPGANPQVVESAVTDILEEELSTVEGLRTLTSSSQEGASNITLEFNLDRDVEAAAQDTRDKVARVRERLPEDVEEPVVAKQDADAQPFFWLALSGANYDLLQLSDIGDRLVKSRLQTLPGVGQARIFGERRFSMRVWLDASQLAARGLTVQDVQQAIRSRNVEVPAGRIESERREFTVRSLGELKTPEEFSDLVVSNTERGAGQAARSGPGRAGAGGRAEHAALQGHVRGRDRRGAAVQVQHHRGGQADPGGAAQDPGVAPARRQHRHRVRPVDLRAALDPGGRGDPAHRRWTGGGDHLRLPPESPRHDHPRPRDSHVHRGHLRDHVLPGLLDQQFHPARAHARHRHRGGRRDHRAGERVPAPGGAGRESRHGGHQRHPGDRLRGARHHHRAGGGVHPARLPQGLDRAPVQRVRHRRRGLGAHLGLRGAHPHADALRQDPAGAPAARGALPGAGAGLQQPGGRVRPGARLRPASPAGGGRPRGRGDRRGGVRLSRPQAGVRAAGGPRLVLQLHHRARGVLAGLHRRLPAAGGGDPGQDQGRRELLQRGEHRRRGEPGDHLHQPGGLVHPHPVGPGDHRRGAAPVLRHPGDLRLRQQSAGVRLREPGELRDPAPQLRLPRRAATTPCSPGPARSRG